MRNFDSFSAFSRNLGWLSEAEQARLKQARVAIAGLGGVGGNHLLTLARLGVGVFNLADYDSFDLANFNRQAGAAMSTLGRPKLEVMRAAVLDIDPGLDLRCFPEGVTEANLDAFLGDAQVYVDGLDFFALDMRRQVFDAALARGIPVVTAAPLGMGVALLVFLPGGPSFEDYFRLEGHSPEEQALRFLVGLAPRLLQRSYLVDDARVDLRGGRGPSTAMACMLCAGVAATETLKLLLGRGPVRGVPWGLQYDAYRQKFVRTFRPGGNAHPLNRLLLGLARRRLRTHEARPPETPPENVLERILDAARWAPSGDNTQPWRFEILGARALRIHAWDTRASCVYDLDGRASQIAHGALLETLAIAASAHGLDARIQRREDSPDTAPVYEVEFVEVPGLAPDPLADFIAARTVDRRPYRLVPLNEAQKRALTDAVAPDFEVVWLERLPERWAMAKLLFHNAWLRLTLPEAYRVHREVIAWNARFSRDKVPDRAIGLDPLTLRLTRWAMQSWARVRFFNRGWVGTLLPRLELDVLPALACAAHFAIVARKPPENPADDVAAGRALARFWLTATRLGLALQPEMTPLVFSRYVWAGRAFTSEPRAEADARALADALAARFGARAPRLVFLGRIGRASTPRARSLRRSLAELVQR